MAAFMKTFELLFVCTGNTCRSPMAEALAHKVLEGRSGISVSSAGLYADPGSSATPQALETVRAMGLDLSKHRSTRLTLDMILNADQIYTMTAAHRRAVLELAPDSEIKVQRLDARRDIDDPIGGDLHLYQMTAAQILQALQDRLQPESATTRGAVS